MGNFTRGKDGKIYYGKGTQGGLAPTPPSFPSGVTTPPPAPPAVVAGVPLPSGYTPINVGEVGSFSKVFLVHEGFTADEIIDIETRPAKADLPKVSWGKLALDEAEQIGYSKISRLSGGQYLVAAGYDNLVENHRLHDYISNPEEAKQRAYNSTAPIQKLLLAMKASAEENNYSQQDVERIDRVLAGYTEAHHINARAFTIDSSGGDERIVYTNDMVRLLDLAKVSYKEEQEDPSDYTKRFTAKADAQKRYMKSVTSQNGLSGGFIQFQSKPSKELIDTRINVKLLEKDFLKESQKKTTFDLFGRQEKKVESIKMRLDHLRKTLEILENRKTTN